MSFRHLGFAAICCGMLLSGCQSIPDGPTPKGPVVTPPPAQTAFTEAGAVNRLAASLSPVLMREYPPGARIVLRPDFGGTDPKAAELPKQVLRRNLDLFPMTLSMNSPDQITSRVERREDGSRRWTMSLKRGTRQPWRDEVIIKAHQDK